MRISDWSSDVCSADRFDRHLTDRYAMDGTAAAMANSIDLGANELDLIAGDLPSAEDLLDSADDAPAVRLINGVLAEAARHGVSAVPIEPYETGLVVRMRMAGGIGRASGRERVGP